MKTFDHRILDLVRCPECGDRLKYALDKEEISCRMHRFPVINGIPSFGDRSDFDAHWDENREERIPINKKSVALVFLKPLLDYLRSRKDCCILDAGCGNGVHLNAISDQNDLLSKNLFVGLDMSLTALKNINRNNNLLLVHGNLTKLPFNDNRFDAILSYGALGYTAEPSCSFIGLCRSLKKGGLLGIWIFPRGSGLLWSLFLMMRKIYKISGPRTKRIIADCIVPLMAFLPIYSKVNLGNATWRQCREVVLINIAPTNLIFPDEEEVREWFRANNLKIVYCDYARPITLWGVKSE